MRETKVRLSTVADVNNFVNAVDRYDCQFNIYAGKYVVDAKSVMGIFSLDLSKPLSLHIESNDDKQITCIMKDISPYIA